MIKYIADLVLKHILKKYHLDKFEARLSILESMSHPPAFSLDDKKKIDIKINNHNTRITKLESKK